MVLLLMMINGNDNDNSDQDDIKVTIMENVYKTPTSTTASNAILFKLV